MPSEGTHCRSLVTPLIQLSPPISPEAKLNLLSGHHKHCQGKRRMKIITRKKIIPLLVLILTIFSVLRLLKISFSTSPSSQPRIVLSPSLQQTCSPPACQPKTSANATTLTKKEFRLLKNLITHKAPCNLLVFGLDRQYIKLSLINAGGITIFLEDDPVKISTIKIQSNTTRIYKVEYQGSAKEAYKLLKHARGNPACAPVSGLLQISTCQLALKSLPQEVYEIKWDVVVVDGPSGDTPEAPGRMAAIYTAGMIARAGNMTDVVVHDTDRTIEKWFSWEFLCDDNLVYSKGKLWDFKIIGKLNSTEFCPAKTIVIQ